MVSGNGVSMTLNDLRALLAPIGARWRARRIRTNSRAIALLDNAYPGVDLNMQIYSLMNNTSPFCTVCGGVVKTLGKTTCSVSCRSKAITPEKTKVRVAKARSTCIERVGVDNYAKLPATQEKRLNTMLEIHGAKVSQKSLESTRSRSNVLNLKGRETLKERYNVNNPGQLPNHNDKCKTTNLEKYGTETYHSSHQYQQKCESARWEVYKALCDDIATLLSITVDDEKMHTYDNPNYVISFCCNTCCDIQAMPTETFRWRIRHYSIPCTKCSGVRKGSVKELQIVEYIASLGVDVQRHQRILCGREIDIYIPSKNIGIEFHGLYWHSELFRSKYYHLEKHKAASSLSIRLMQIFEDEWDNHQYEIKERLRELLCNTATPPDNQPLSHTTSGNVVEISVFNQVVSFAQATDVWVMISKPFITETAITSAFRYFVNEFCPCVVITHIDHRWMSDNFVASLNFKYQSTSVPSVWYIDRSTWDRVDKAEVIERLQTLATFNNKKMYIRENYLRIWDCGYSTWAWYAT